MPLPVRPPVIVHHKGALDQTAFPPNSLETLAASVEAGAAFVEIDVTALQADDYLLVHDADLAAETTGAGAVAKCAVADIRDLRIKVDGAATAYHVPTLSEVVALLRGSSTRLQIDYKNVYPFPDDEPLERLIRLIEPLGRGVLVSTGADWQLRKLRTLAPDLDLGFDIHFYIDWQDPAQPRHPEVYPRQLGAYGYYDDHPLATRQIWSKADYLADRCGALIGLVSKASAFYVDHKLLAQSLDDGFNWAKALHAAGIKCDAWTLDVGDPQAEANAKRLLAAGVDQFTSNTPLALAALLDSTSAR